MSTFVSRRHLGLVAFTKRLPGTFAATFCAGLALWAMDTASAQVPANAKVPDLASISFAWQAAGVHWLDPPPGMGRGPIRQDPAYHYHSNVDGPGQVTPDLGNTKDPVLKPWAAAQMQESNEEVLSGKRGLPFSAQQSCYPGGVPEQLLTPAQPFYFIQTPKQVWMIWETDHQVRRIYLTDKHSSNLKPQSFGESIGHYEGDNTLVVDTIGLATKNNYIDNFRTPHTEKEHVVERFTISPDGKQLMALVTVDDPDTFNEPIHMKQTWHKVVNPLLETVCAENNNDSILFHQKLFPMPEAAKPDF